MKLIEQDEKDVFYKVLGNIISLRMILFCERLTRLTRKLTRYLCLLVLWWLREYPQIRAWSTSSAMVPHGSKDLSWMLLITCLVVTTTQ